MRPGFGVGRLHHLVSRRERERVVLGALDARFKHLDVAPAYGDGLVERELGRILGKRRAEITITTKYGIPFRPIGELPAPAYLALRAAGKLLHKSFGANYGRRDFSAAAMVASLENSLRRLRTEHVDYLLVHEPLALEEFRTLSDVWPEMERQQRLGKVGRFGVSSNVQMLLDAQNERLVPEAAVLMIPMNEISCKLPFSWFEGREVFVFNVVKHLSRSRGPGRIPARVLVEEFARVFPTCRPVFSTHDPAEMKKMREALASFVAADSNCGAR